jgi:Ca-activated chloride channel family protein
MTSLRCSGLIILALVTRVLVAAEAVSFVGLDSETAVFDVVEVVVEVETASPIASVSISVDGWLAGVLTRPPYRLVVNVGEENREHEFVAVASFVDGTREEARVVTPAVVIDDEVDLALEQLYVTAIGAAGPVLDLRADELTIIDGGRRQHLVTFARGDIPMTLAVLVDASESMSGGYLAGAVAATEGLLSRLNPLDEAMVMVFSDRLHALSETRATLDELGGQLQALQPGGATALNDHLYAALRMLDSRQGRPVVILLSDGADTLSLLKAEEVLWKVRRSEAVIYRVQVQGSIGQSFGSATVWRDLHQQKAEIDGLDRAIVESGGRVRLAEDIDHLAEALDEILQELREQYVLGYYPEHDDEQPAYRPVEVVVSRPAVEIRVRAGLAR